MKFLWYLSAVAATLASSRTVVADKTLLQDGCPSCAPLLEVIKLSTVGVGESEEMCTIARQIYDCECGEYQTPVFEPFVKCVCDPQDPQHGYCVVNSDTTLVNYIDDHNDYWETQYSDGSLGK